MKKRKIYGVIVSVKNVTVDDICKYCLMDQKEVNKYVDQLIKEGKVCYSTAL